MRKLIPATDMLPLPLEPTDDRANPAFKDAAGCEQWLGQLQLTNLQQAHSALRKQLDELNRFPMRGLERMQTLEQLRETVGYVQEDYAKKLVAKALPLSETELEIFVAITALWQGMVVGYQRCLQACTAGDQQLMPYVALLCHRCLIYGGRQILEYLRSGYEINGELWYQQHALYAYAEEQGMQATEIEDALNTHAPNSTCSTAYLKTLLACHAHPEELSRSQLQLLDRWLSKWAALLTLERSYAQSRGDAPPLAVDLDSRSGLQPLDQAHDAHNPRYLAMVPLSKLLRVNTILLQQGQMPQQLELGRGINATDCAEFLVRLHHNWCEERPQRMAERSQSSLERQVCYGLEGIYAHVANKPFRQQKGKGPSEASGAQIATFGRVLSDTNRHDLAALGYIQEIWRIEDESLLGARMLRQETETGMRLTPRQIIATRGAGAPACTLGAITWLTVLRNGQLRAGVRYLPGAPEAIAAKVGGTSHAALLLPAMPDLGIPSSLIIPRNLFQAGHPLEITANSGEKQNVKMGICVERGFDYERISYSKG